MLKKPTSQTDPLLSTKIRAFEEQRRRALAEEQALRSLKIRIPLWKVVYTWIMKVLGK